MKHSRGAGWSAPNNSQVPDNGRKRKEGDVLQGQRVLVVDQAPDTADILRAVLEPRGMQVDRVRSSARRRSETPANPPAVLVIDAEQPSSPESPAEAWPAVPRVIIGSISGPSRPDAQSDRHYLAKPFQYAELVQTIERLAGRRAA